MLVHAGYDLTQKDYRELYLLRERFGVEPPTALLEDVMASRRRRSCKDCPVARIAIIGGGSAYMPGLAFSFARESQRFAGSTLVLHDIDPDALDVQTRLTGSILRAHAAAM